MRKFVLVYQLKINYEITSKVIEARNVSEAWESGGDRNPANNCQYKRVGGVKNEI